MRLINLRNGGRLVFEKNRVNHRVETESSHHKMRAVAFPSSLVWTSS